MFPSRCIQAPAGNIEVRRWETWRPGSVSSSPSAPSRSGARRKAAGDIVDHELQTNATSGITRRRPEGAYPGRRVHRDEGEVTQDRRWVWFSSR